MSKITDRSYNRISLARELRPIDFYKYKDLNLADESTKYKYIEETLRSFEDGFPEGVDINKIQIGSNKPMYAAGSLGVKLLLRKTQKNLNCLRPRQKSRNRIVRELKQVLRDGSSYRLYKLDIANFFENIDANYLNGVIQDLETTNQTKDFTEKILHKFNDSYSPGIPRGLEISPTLADITLNSFDDLIISSQNVFYYSRFVDDIIMVTDGKEERNIFLRSIRKSLPDGLYFNHNKKFFADLPRHRYDNSRIDFDYLGYRISIYSNGVSNKKCKENFRGISVDLSKTKKNNLSNRVIKSFHAYYKNKLFRLLVDRLTFLSTNRNILDQTDNRVIPTGIYYNHSEVGKNSESLVQLDKLVKILTLSPKGRISKKQEAEFSKQEISELLKISFARGFEERIFKTYSPNRLREIVKIWR